MSGAPPLFSAMIDLTTGVHAIADRLGISDEERRAAIGILAIIVCEGEPSHVRALERIADIVEFDRPRLLVFAAEEAQDQMRREQAILARERRGPRRPAPAAKRTSKPKPQEETQLRWDQQ